MITLPLLYAVAELTDIGVGQLKQIRPKKNNTNQSLLKGIQQDCCYILGFFSTQILTNKINKIMESKAKDKAKELLNKYLWIAYAIDKFHAKQCAIIAIDQIIENNSELLDGIKYYEELNEWEEVKEEIKKL